MARTIPGWPVALGLALGAACSSSSRAGLEVELAGPASVVPLVFHGNCFAGLQLSFALRLRETEGAPLDLVSLAYEVRESATGDLLGGEAIEGAALHERYGAEAGRLGPHGSHDFGLGLRILEEGPRRLMVTGEARGTDEEGTVRRDYRLDLGEVAAAAPDLPAGGACGQVPAG
jgi:hypothetical protein